MLMGLSEAILTPGEKKAVSSALQTSQTLNQAIFDLLIAHYTHELERFQTGEPLSSEAYLQQVKTDTDPFKDLSVPLSEIINAKPIILSCQHHKRS
jgi:hypothetical protein